MTPERKQELIALREVRDELGELFKKARDDWTKACGDLNYALLQEVEYYQYMQKIVPDFPEWYNEVMGIKTPKEVMTRRKADALVERMLRKTTHAKVREKKHDSRKPLWKI